MAFEIWLLCTTQWGKSQNLRIYMVDRLQLAEIAGAKSKFVDVSSVILA
jgi:hypothetical protein